MFKKLYGYEYIDGVIGVQSLKLNLPENYKSSNEEKKRQVNKL